MIQLSIHDVEANLPRVLAELATGGTVVLVHENVPIAEVRPLPRTAPREPRPVGLASPPFRVPASFFEPLPEDLLEAFEGNGG